MGIWIELVFFAVLPIAFAVWQLRDLKREKRKREARRAHDAASNKKDSGAPQ